MGSGYKRHTLKCQMRYGDVYSGDIVEYIIRVTTIYISNKWFHLYLNMNIPPMLNDIIWSIKVILSAIPSNGAWISVGTAIPHIYIYIYIFVCDVCVCVKHWEQTFCLCLKSLFCVKCVTSVKAVEWKNHFVMKLIYFIDGDWCVIYRNGIPGIIKDSSWSDSYFYHSLTAD